MTPAETASPAAPRGPLFDAYIVVDWSAAATPKRGADSIWWALARRGENGPALEALENPSTRAEAVDALRARLLIEQNAGRRALVGFDFPFAYPGGAAAAMLDADDDEPSRERAAPLWERLWALLARRVTDGPRNETNRLAAAGALNGAWPAAGPFWGNGSKTEIPGLGRKKPRGYGEALPQEHRLVERRRHARGGPRPKSAWQLSGAGSVGSQTLTGVPVVERLRHDPALRSAARVWPFETGLRPVGAPVLLAEVYPSLLPAAPAPGEPKDAAQVRGLALRFAALDAAGALARLLAGPQDLSPAERRLAEQEEGWILGAEDDWAFIEPAAF